MSQVHSIKPSITSKTPATQEDYTVEVLYQKLGDRWFAFSLVDDEVFVGTLTPEEIHGASFAGNP